MVAKYIPHGIILDKVATCGKHALDGRWLTDHFAFDRFAFNLFAINPILIIKVQRRWLNVPNVKIKYSEVNTANSNWTVLSTLMTVKSTRHNVNHWLENDAYKLLATQSSLLPIYCQVCSFNWFGTTQWSSLLE